MNNADYAGFVVFAMVLLVVIYTAARSSRSASKATAQDDKDREIRILKNQVAGLEEQRSAFSSNVALIEENAKLKAECDRMARRCVEARHEIDDLMVSHSSPGQRTIKTLEERLKAAGESMGELQEKLTASTEQCEELERVNDKLEGQVTALQSRGADLGEAVNKIEPLQEQVERLTTLCTSLNESITYWRDKFETLQNSCNDSSATRVASLQTELGELRKEMAEQFKRAEQSEAEERRLSALYQEATKAGLDWRGKHESQVEREKSMQYIIDQLQLNAGKREEEQKELVKQRDDWKNTAENWQAHFEQVVKEKESLLIQVHEFKAKLVEATKRAISLDQLKELYQQSSKDRDGLMSTVHELNAKLFTADKKLADLENSQPKATFSVVDGLPVLQVESLSRTELEHEAKLLAIKLKNAETLEFTLRASIEEWKQKYRDTCEVYQNASASLREVNDKLAEAKTKLEQSVDKSHYEVMVNLRDHAEESLATARSRVNRYVDMIVNARIALGRDKPLDGCFTASDS